MNKNLLRFFVIFIVVIITACSYEAKPDNKTPAGIQENNIDGKNKGISDKIQVNSIDAEKPKALVNPSGATIQERFDTPDGFERITVDEDSFEAYLQNLPLKPNGSKVRYYNGRIKNNDVYEAVIDIDVGDRDLQQCADAVMRLWAEYLYGRKMYDKIHFNFTNGFNADYQTWADGNRIMVEDNKAWWVKKTGYSNEYSNFRQYLDMVFAYAGTQSLANEMKKVILEDIRIGDVFLKGDLPGHCVIVVDMAESISSGEKLFMVAQSYMPAQDIHVLKNSNDSKLSPWYTVNFGERLVTPEWEFTKDQLYRFCEVRD